MMRMSSTLVPWAGLSTASWARAEAAARREQGAATGRLGQALPLWPVLVEQWCLSGL